MPLRELEKIGLPIATAADARAQLRRVHTDDDVQLAAFIAAATEQLGGRNGTLGRAIVRQRFELVLRRFPRGAIELPLPPLATVESITYTDMAGAVQTLAATAYRVDIDSEPGTVEPADAWPATAERPDAVRVRFVAGYEDAAIPARLKLAVLMLAADFDAHRGAQADKPLASNPAVDALTFGYRMLRP